MTPTISLRQIASARSGDKGNHANIGIVAYSTEGYLHLVEHLTCERVQHYFSRLGPSSVERFLLPRVDAINFVLLDALGGGASQSLQIDTQGKLLGTAILDLTLPAPSWIASE